MKIHRIRAVMRRHLDDMFRTPTRVNNILVWPAIDTLLFGSIGAFLATQIDGDLGAAFLLSGLFMFHVVFQSGMALSLGFMTETNDRNLLNLFATPVTLAEYLTGLVLFGLVKMLMGLGLIVVMTLTLFDYNVFTGGWGLLPFIIVLMMIGLGLSLMMIALQLRLGQAAQELTYVMPVLVPALSGVFVPVAALPSVLQPVSRILPTTNAFEAVRGLIAGQPFPVNDFVVSLLGATAVLGLGALVLAVALRVFRSQGLVGRYS